MAKPKKDVVGETYGRLVIIDDAPYRSKDRRVFVKCVCGTVKDVLLGDLRRGDTTSCGCYLQEVITKHGDASNRLYKIYHGMLDRCYLPTIPGYENYGARGITVCDQWQQSYEEFKDWATASGYTDVLSIDREDVDGPYTPANCRWIPMGEQQRNKRKLAGTSAQYIGVSFCKRTSKWLSYIKVNGVMKNLGRFLTEAEAATARNNYITVNKLANFKLNVIK